MRQVLALTLLAAASACGPAPAHMPATRASEVLERFAAGAAASDVCTPNGRAELRGAVRAYGAEMNANGRDWPSIPALGDEPDDVDGVEISVLVAFAAGFVDRSDFQGPARAALSELAFAHWPEMRGIRAAAREACEEVVALQQAAARVVMEMERMRQMRDAGAERLARQQHRVERAHVQMQQQAAFVAARMEAAREG